MLHSEPRNQDQNESESESGSKIFENAGLGFAISDKKLFRRRRNGQNTWFVPVELFRGTETVEFNSETFLGREKCLEF